MRLTVYFSEMVLFGSFAAVMAEMEASPQGQMANPQGIAVERPGLPEDFVFDIRASYVSYFFVVVVS